jgi:hypothetical protein
VRPTLKAAVSTLLLVSLLLTLPSPGSTKTKPKPKKHRVTWAIRADRVCATRYARPVAPPKKRTKTHMRRYVRRITTQTAAVVKKHSAIRVKRRKAETRALRREKAVLAQLKKVSRDLRGGVTKKFKRDYRKLKSMYNPLARSFAAVRAPHCAYVIRPV